MVKNIQFRQLTVNRFAQFLPLLKIVTRITLKTPLRKYFEKKYKNLPDPGAKQTQMSQVDMSHGHFVLPDMFNALFVGHQALNHRYQPIDLTTCRAAAELD